MILDREGNFWCAMYQKGVYMHRKEAAPFRYQGQCNGPYNTIGDAAVAAVCITRDSHIWVSTDGGGIYELDHSGALLKHFDNKLVPPAVLSMTEDEAGRLWVASYVRGAGWIDRSTGTYHQLPCTMGRGHSVFDILLDGKGKLWIGTLGDGLKCFDMKTQEVRNSALWRATARHCATTMSRGYAFPLTADTFMWALRRDSPAWTSCRSGG